MWLLIRLLFLAIAYNAVLTWLGYGLVVRNLLLILLMFLTGAAIRQART